MVDCPHCPGGFGLKHPLDEDADFIAVCDVHPIVEGHILLITKKHLSCCAIAPSINHWYAKIKEFLKKTYGSVAVFEHGVVSQTVFHAHLHFLPFRGTVEDIVSEGCRKISSFDEARKEFKENEGYLFVEIDGQMWTCDISLATPRFFRDRFAAALGAPERGDWKAAKQKETLLEAFEKDIHELETKW